MDSTVIVALITSITTAILVPLVQFAISKATRKEERDAKKLESKDEWQKTVDEKLATDKARLDALTRDVSDQKEMDKMLLKGVMLITGHLCDGNHTEMLKKYSSEVDEYLIEKS